MDVINLDTVPVRADGSWGPRILPLVPATTFSFELHAPSFVPQEVLREPPRSGARIYVDFAPAAGLTLNVHVVDAEMKSLAAATVSLLWNAAGNWTKIDGQADSDGTVRFDCCPAGTIWLRARCPGYAARRLDPMELSHSTYDPFLIRLTRTGRIDGHCTHNGEPVDSFTVVYWKDDPAARDFLDVRGSGDGHFVIDDAPVGTVSLTGYSDLLPRSDVTTVQVDVDRATTATLALPASLHGHGRVVDAITGAPLPQATLQVNVLFNNVILKPWGPPQPVGADGTFDLSGLVFGYNGLMISCPGFGQRSVIQQVSTDAPVDIGPIGLFAKQSIIIQLNSMGPTEWSSVTAQLVGTHDIGQQVPTPEGIITYSDLEPGPYALRIALPDGSLLSDSLMLRPGQDLHVTERLDATAIRVELLPPPGMPLPNSMVLRLNYANSTGSSIDRNYRMSGTFCTIPGIDSDSAVLSVEDWDGGIYGYERVLLHRGTTQTVSVHIGSQRTSFRVVDSSHQPVHSAHVILTLPNDGSGWMEDSETDANGLCSFPLDGIDTIYLAAYSFSIGLKPSSLVQLNKHSNLPLEVVLAPQTPLKVQFRDRDRAASYIDSWCEDRQGVRYGLGAAMSDENGQAQWGAVSAGEFAIRISQPGYWPKVYRIASSTNNSPEVIQARRVGSLEFDAHTPYGNPATDVTLEMWYDETNEVVSDWVSMGLAVTGNNTLTCDSRGVLKIEAIPDGNYHWRATSLDGSIIEGDAVVAPFAVAHVELLILH